MQQPDLECLFPGQDELAHRLRELDWSLTELGPVADWSASLGAAVRFCLTARFPSALYWGPSLTLVYNAAYAPLLGPGAHLRCLGRPLSQIDGGHSLLPRLLRLRQGAQGDLGTDERFFIARAMPREEVYFRFSYSPLVGADGKTVEGVLAFATEVTDHVVSARRLETLRKLGVRSATAPTLQAVAQQAAQVMGDNPHDIQFAAVYLADEGGQRATLAATTRLDGAHGLPASVATADGDKTPWPLAAVLASHHSAEVGDLDTLASLAGGLGWEPVTQAVVLPVPGTASTLAGLLVVGVSPRRGYDAAYQTFFALLAGHLGAALAEAQAVEAGRRRTDELLASDRARTAFFNNVSHEFRTPLTLMLGPTKEALATPARALRGNELELVYRNQLRLLRLVNTLLDFASIEAGRLQALYTPVNLGALTADLASAFRSMIESAGMKLIVDCRVLSQPVYVDLDLWEKIIFNLMSNAFKYTLEGGVFISVRELLGKAQVAVRDTGIGIAARDLPQLFQRFHRIDKSKARTREGSGIGLALVKELVHAHGGELTVESQPGKGTTFTVTIPFGTAHLAVERISAQQRPGLPLFQAPGLAAEAPPELPVEADPELAVVPASPADAAEHIVLADDNADMRAYLTRLLGRRWSVEAVADGNAALAAVRERRPTLLICDIMMPGLDGFELIHTLRQDPQLCTIPIMLLSARADEESRIEGLAAGADDYIVKPFAARELLTRVVTRLQLSRLSARLEQERQAIMQLFLQTPVPVAVFRGPELTYECVNAAYASALERTDLRGKPLLAALPEVKDQGLAETLRTVMATGVAHVEREVLLQLQRKGKLTDTYWTSIYAPLRNEPGESQRIIAICNEVTRQVQSGQQLTLLATEANAANRSKDEFLAMLGHELRNPLAPIVAALHLMRMRGTRSRELEIIERQVSNLTRLVDDLLDISRISGGKIELRKRPIELAVVIAQAIELASPLLQSRAHPVDVQVAARGLGICADLDRMVQTFSNLLTNAAKYSEPGSPIVISADRRDDRIIVKVRDQGVGIAPEMLDKVFDRFVQQPHTRAKSRGGLGLGLTIVRSLVEGHGGAVSVHSDGPGRGSVFTVDLPADYSMPLSEPKLGAAPAPSEGAEHQRILVVDDNEDAATTMQLALQELGYTVEVVGDGPQALHATQVFHPDIALIDIGLPDMDGYELARRLRARGELRPELHLVAVTGYGQESDRQHSKEAGFDKHLVKPVDLNVLHKILKEFSAVRA
ncbi:MAG TPA: ATP-binding protein [Pseudomonadota bacterium]|nr:ATP-binding protein [Pseudomonadota bacterium]